jgi:hypothetical protein
MAYKNDDRKKLPYPSFVIDVLRASNVRSVGTLLTSPSEVSGLDKKVVQKMHYVQEKMEIGIMMTRRFLAHRTRR